MKQRFDHGTHNTPVSTTNSAGTGSDAFTHIVINNLQVNAGNSNVVYHTDAAADGAMGCRIFLSSSTTYLRRDETFAGTRWGQRSSFDVPAGTLSAEIDVFSARGSGGLIDSMRVRTTKKAAVAVGTAGGTVVASESPVLDPGRYFAEVFFTLESAAGAANGTVELRVTRASDNQLMHSWSTSTASTGTAAPTQYRFGGSTTATGLTYVDIDSIEYGALASGFFGRMTPLANAPVVNDMATTMYRRVSYVSEIGPSTVTVSPSTGVIQITNGVLLPVNETTTTYTVNVTDTGASKTTTKTFDVEPATATDWEILVRVDGVWTDGEMT